MNSGGQNPEFVLREFQGMNVVDAREAIGDEEFAWCENAIPVASAQAFPVRGPALLITIAGETGAPSYIQTFNVTGTDFAFAVWAISGNGWIVNMTTLIATKIITGLSSGKTSATQYSNKGLLIVDNFTGYFDWNITAPNTLTTIAGVSSGQSIATYAGRVWIGSGRVVFFTDINSYNSFAGAGGSFTINDAYMHNNITALFSANNYLYIFGDTSIDALSNVTVSGGVTAFSRINVTASVGTITPTSIFPYYRAIIFYHSSGFYLLSGATPEKISQKISGIVKNIVVVGVGFSTPLGWGAPVLIQGELCATLLFSFTDVFTQGGAVRTLFALYFRGRWWVASWPGLQVQSMFSISMAGNQTMYAWVGNSLYQAFNAGSTLSAWLLKTKLWDAGSPLTEKQSLTAAFAGVFSGLGSTGVTINVDTELGTFPTAPVTLAGNPTNYALFPTAANAGAPSGAQYLGLTVAGSTDVTEIHLLALRGKADRDLMR
jgi:hypothetical protein